MKRTNQDDPLGPARGIALAVVLGAFLWFILLYPTLCGFPWRP